MSNVKFFKTTSDNLPPISDGQFIAVTDTGEIYIDTGEERKVYGGADFSGTGEYSVQIGSEAEATANSSTSIGFGASATAISTLAIGKGAIAEGAGAISIGEGTKTSGFCSIQLGAGENSVDGTFSVGLLDNYVLLESNGKIPDERLNDTIARVADIPDIPDTSNFVTLEDIPDTSNFITLEDIAPTNGSNVCIAPSTFEIQNPGSASVLLGAAINANSSLYATAVGPEAICNGEGSISIGHKSESVGDYSIAIGDEAKTSYRGCVAIGGAAEVRGHYSMAIGDGAVCDGMRSIAIGGVVEALNSIQLGSGTTDTNNTFSVALDKNYILLGDGGKIPDDRLNDTIARAANIPDFYGADVRLGENSTTNGNGSIAIGQDSYAIHTTSIALGSGAKANSYGAIQIGWGENTDPYTLSVGWFKMIDGFQQVNYPLLTFDGKIPIERLPDGIGGSSWTKTTDTSTTEISLTIADQNEYVYNASATSVSITVTDFTGESVVHFSSGSTASTFTCAAKMIGYHCYGGTFTPVKNTRYSIMFSHDGLNVIGHVGGYANG